MNGVKERFLPMGGITCRNLGSSTFLRRMTVLQGELQKQAYPNATTLAAKCGCSRSTAMRTIDRLRYDFGVPLEYDESNRGYFLTNPKYQFALLPLGISELVALVVVREIVRSLGDTQLQEAIDAIWAASVNGRDDLLFDVRRIDGRFNSSLSKASYLSRVGVTHILWLCHRGQLVSMSCERPRGSGTCVELVGTFVGVSLRDGALLGSFRDVSGKESALNLSSIRSLREISSLERAG